MSNFKAGIVTCVTHPTPDEFVFTIDGEDFTFTKHHVIFLTRPGVADGQVVFGEAQHVEVGDELIKEWERAPSPVFPGV